MTESQKQVIGTWTAKLPDGSETNGSVSGGLLTTLYVLSFSRDLAVTCPASTLLKGTGTISIDARLSGSDTLSGSYEMILCDDVRIGTIELRRQ